MDWQALTTLNELAGWVLDSVSYMTDVEQYGFSQYWASPEETLRSMRGDCDCRAVLFASLAFERVGYKGYFILSSSPDPREGHVSIAFSEIPELFFLTGERERPWLVFDVLDYDSAMRIVKENRGRNIGPRSRPNAPTVGDLDLSKLEEYAMDSRRSNAWNGIN